MKSPPETRISLLVRLRNPQDELAWTEFATLYRPLIVRLTRRYGLQDADACDIAQQVFAAVAQAIHRYDPDRARGSFRGWLQRITRNLVINLLVQQRRHPRGSGKSDFFRMLDEQPARGEESELFDREYRLELYRWAVDRIRSEFREATWAAFQRTCIDGQPISATAEALGISVGAVYVARSRIIARLRQLIEDFEEQ